MSTVTQISRTPAAAVEYVKAKLVLVAFDRGLKGPDWKGWNLRENCITSVERASDCHGSIGLAHAYSGTCCLDIDDKNSAFLWFAARDIDLLKYMNATDAVRYTGQPGRCKLLFRWPPNVTPLRTKMYKANGFELRCATVDGKTVQDVLPPSIHPKTGKPYSWDGPCDFRHIPEIPAELFALWQSLCEPRTITSTGAVTPIGAGREDIEALLAKIDPAKLPYDDWLYVGMALHFETQGHVVGLDLWDNWSISDGKNPLYKGRDELDSKWEGFKIDHAKPRTLRTIARLAGAEDFSAEYEVVEDGRAPGAPRFKIESSAEFAACEYEDDFIDGVIPDAPYGVIMGQSGSGKTFAAIDLTFAMARGVLWRGRDTKPARVLYIAAEGSVGVRKRLKAHAQHHRVALADINVEFLGAAPDLTRDGDLDALIAAINARGSFTHIVIDTWSQVTPGADENSSHDMGAALARVQKLHRATGARILFVAHMGKDMSKGMRGWSGFKAAMDYEIEVARDGEQRTLTVSKSRDSIDGVRFAFHLQPVSLGFTKRGKPVVSCVVVHDVAIRRRPASKVQTAVLATIELYFEANDGAWMPFADVLQIFKKRMRVKQHKKQPIKDQSRTAVVRALLQLAAKKWIEEKDGNYRPFTIPADL